MDIFLTASALERHRELLETVRPPHARWLTLHDDGRITRPDTGEGIDPTGATPEIAWFTPDIYDGGPIRPFFGLVVRSTTLRWFQSSAAGVDDPVFARLMDRGVTLTTAHISGPPIADFVLRAALDHLQDAPAWRAAEAEHRWEPHEFTEMGSTRWLVIGLGTIGTEVAIRARAFGAHVTGVRRSHQGNEPTDAMARPDEVPQLLPDADVVVLSLPAAADTTRLVDADFLARMKPGSVLINVGRGALIDEAALVSALDTNQLGRAVLDVTATEPLPPDDPLWRHPQVVVTPHSSALGDGRYDRAAQVFAENLRRYCSGEPLRHQVDPTALNP